MFTSFSKQLYSNITYEYLPIDITEYIIPVTRSHYSHLQRIGHLVCMRLVFMISEDVQPDNNGSILIYNLPYQFRPLKEFKKEIILTNLPIPIYCQLQIYMNGDVYIENSGVLKSNEVWFWINETFI